MEREYQNFCDRCGQALDWRQYAHAGILLVSGGVKGPSKAPNSLGGGPWKNGDRYGILAVTVSPMGDTIP